MSGVATGQVFTEHELERLLNWYCGVFTGPADVALAAKVRDYLDRTACRVPR